MSVQKLMAAKPREVHTIGPSASVEEAMDLLIEKKIGCLPVLDENSKPLGIISDADIFAKIHETRGKYHSLKVSDIMTTDLIVGVPDDDIDYIAGIMEKNWIRHVPIVEKERVVGLVSLRDILISRAKKVVVENRYLVSMLHSRDLSGDI